MKNCIYEPVFGLFLLFNFQIDSALTFSRRLIDKKEPVVICDQSKLDVTKCDINKVASNIELLIKEFRKTINAYG